MNDADIVREEANYLYSTSTPFSNRKKSHGRLLAAIARMEDDLAFFVDALKERNRFEDKYDECSAELAQTHEEARKDSIERDRLKAQLVETDAHAMSMAKELASLKDQLAVSRMRGKRLEDELAGCLCNRPCPNHGWRT